MESNIRTELFALLKQLSDFFETGAGPVAHARPIFWTALSAATAKLWTLAGALKFSPRAPSGKLFFHL